MEIDLRLEIWWLELVEMLKFFRVPKLRFSIIKKLCRAVCS